MRKLFTTLVAYIFALQGSLVTAQENTTALIPMPNSIEAGNGKCFQMNTKSAIRSNLPEDAFVINELKRILQERTGITPLYDNSRSRNIIELTIDPTLNGSEHYTLKVDKRGITIKGATEGALFWGIQTLDQLLLGDICNTMVDRIAHISIDDAPRFAHRAIMLDPART